MEEDSINQEPVKMGKKLKSQYRFKIDNTKPNRKLFTRNYIGLNVQF